MTELRNLPASPTSPGNSCGSWIGSGRREKNDLWWEPLHIAGRDMRLWQLLPGRLTGLCGNEMKQVPVKVAAVVFWFVNNTIIVSFW